MRTAGHHQRHHVLSQQGGGVLGHAPAVERIDVAVDKQHTCGARQVVAVIRRVELDRRVGLRLGHAERRGTLLLERTALRIFRREDATLLGLAGLIMSRTVNAHLIREAAF
eukprot:SAG11_NODE_47_length_20431_cov_7.472752_9_plen_111_part_00